MPATIPAHAPPGLEDGREVCSAEGPGLWRPRVLSSRSPPSPPPGFNFSLARNSAPLRPRAPSLPLGIFARLSEWRRPGSSFPRSAVS